MHTNITEKWEVKQLIGKILPTVIKLLLADQPTDRLACLIELGELLGMEQLESNVISKVSLTSIQSSTQN